MEQLEKALLRLKEVLVMPQSDVVRDSAIQRFEFTMDLSWKTVKTYLEEMKGLICASPKECFREAYRQGIVLYDDEWIKLVDLRNETVHTYNEEIAEKIYNELPATVRYFKELVEKMK
mgnify:FL=1